MREEIRELLREATGRVLEGLGADPGLVDRIELTPARSPEHGDLASNAALALSRSLGMPPRELAARIAAELRDPQGWVERTEIAGPGFINLFLVSSKWHEWIERALREGRSYGISREGQGQRVQVEFVSANPTGPLTIGHGRNAVLGDAVARLLEATGWSVSREYYFNDGGRQMRVLGDSLRARYQQELGRAAELPGDGYRGDYLVAIARELVREQGEAWLDADDAQFEKRARDAIFADINRTLERLGIHFDSYYNENSLYEEGLVERALADLRERELVYEGEGAVWLRSSALGLERDRVLVRSTGEPTYLLPDIAYHREKFRRGFELLIDVLGPDHIEQFPYARAAVAALGHAPERLEQVMYQWVNLRTQGEIVKMSTRQASFITIDEVLDEVGSDVFRYFMVERRADTHLDFDLDLARERSERNPVYKVQYAHARLCSIARRALEAGFEEPEAGSVAYEPLALDEERDLARRLGRYPETVSRAAREREPQIVARYLLDLATAFHSYVTDAERHRVISEDRELTRARLALAAAVRLSLGNGLELLGIAAPERM